MTVGRMAAALLVASSFGSAALAASAAAQGQPVDPQGIALREAATLESRGDLDGAEAALRRLLTLDPTSAGAIFALERVLRAQGDVRELRPLVDAYLARVPDVEVRALKLKLLAEADSTQAMVSEAEAWIAADPREPVFSAVAAVYEQALGPERALDVLRRGRGRLGGDALALQTGDVRAAAGDLEGAADEWARAVGDDGSGMESVRSRLSRLGMGRAVAASRVVRALGASDISERRRATLRLAFDMRLEADALELAQRHSGTLGGRAKATFLNEIGVQALQADMSSIASWAYAALGEVASSPEERRQFDRRIVDISWEAGDIPAALAAQRRVAASFTGRSDEWRRALADVIKLEAVVEPQRMVESWAAFRTEFPAAPELDGVAAAIAASRQARGDDAGAAAALEGIEGPRSSLERAYLLLAGGEIEGARAMLLRAVGGLPPSEATPVIQFASLLGRLSEPGKQALAAAGVQAHRGGGAEAAASLVEAVGGLGRSDAPPLLGEAARMAERAGAPEAAVAIRRRLIEEYPDAPEMAEATLALARHAARSGDDDDDDEAIRMLEDLITRRPNAAVVPEARLELQRLRNRGS